jgi:hypothetical protein
MAAPFGFSVGDFIAGIGVLRDVIGAFSDTKGARTSYKEVVQELSSLQSSLEGIQALKCDPGQEDQYAAVTDAVERCQQCIKRFVERMSKFKDILSAPGASQWPSSNFKRSVQKIEWSLCRKSDVEQFRKEVQIHKAAILSLQASLLR